MDLLSVDQDCVSKNKDEDTGEEELKVGMKVESEDEAYDLYNQYAFRKGFSIRKGNKRVVDGVLRQREFLCSKEGFHEFADPYEVKKVNRLDTRTGCKARIRFTIEDGVWVISHFNSVHNHEFASEEERPNLRSGRRVPTAYGGVISSMVGAGIKPTKSYSFISKALGGAQNVGFTKKDCHNYLRTERKKMIEAGDGQSIMNHFQQRQAEDPLFFYSVQVDQQNRMANFFWRDGRSKLDYKSFGDVIIFDTTYRTNRYNLVCAPFVGINHHWKNVLFGCAFLVDETTESFIWLFKTFLAAMGGRQPKSIFTDQDHAMANAIKEIFPESRHRLCLWHISKNARQHLAGLYGNPNFNAKFNKCLSGCLNETEFQSTWDEMIETFNLKGHKWLERLYDSREKWCTALSVDIFSAKMKSTQRSESTNSVFHQVMGISMPLIQVIQYYEQKAKNMRQEESDEDFRCKNGSFANVISHGGILAHAANVYTIRLFKMFEEEVLDGLGMNCAEANIEGTMATYQLSKPKLGHKKVHIVTYDRSTSNISCSCKLFQTLGLLCRHASRVLLVNNFNEIPVQYILSRWTKDARKGLVCNPTRPLDKNEKSACSLRLSELNHIGHNVFDKASITETRTKIVKEKLLEALELIEKDSAGVGNEEFVRNNEIDRAIEMHCSGEDVLVLDPPQVKRKGLTNARIKSQFEKNCRKKSKVMPKFQMSGSSYMSGKNLQENKQYPPSLSQPMHDMGHNQESFNQMPMMNSTLNWNFSHPHSSFTRMLQENTLMPHMSQDSCTWFGGNAT